ncbi:MAG: UrcA family protein [Hyphomonadaceae bacterium]
MTHSPVLLAAAIGALTLFAVPSVAQDNDADAYYDDEIVIEAPGVYRQNTGRRTSSGARIEQLTTKRLVTTNDLDLRRRADVAELYRRIDDTVRDACNEVERAGHGVLITSERECIRDARRGAYAQAEVIVDARRG